MCISLGKVIEPAAKEPRGNPDQGAIVAYAWFAISAAAGVKADASAGVAGVALRRAHRRLEAVDVVAHSRLDGKLHALEGLEAVGEGELGQMVLTALPLNALARFALTNQMWAAAVCKNLAAASRWERGALGVCSCWRARDR